MANIDFTRIRRAEDRAAEAAADAVARDLAFLAATDWYVLRKAETGAAIPPDVATARAEARARVPAERGPGAGAAAPAPPQP